ncbi:MAG: hypothetical protein KY460_02320 [Actinobacteria bacterium]|nr:hypothetical protein [Actinomycetota bacterium]
MWRSVALGAITGMRSQLPAALLAWRQAQEALPEGIAGPGRIFRRRGAVPLLALFAVGELIADKLPMTPSRMEAGPLLGRLALGATAGAGIASALGRSRIVGGLLGGVGAAAGALLGSRYREYAAQQTDTPDAVWALLEDVVAVAIGLVATRGPAS